MLELEVGKSYYRKSDNVIVYISRYEQGYALGRFFVGFYAHDGNWDSYSPNGESGWGPEFNLDRECDAFKCECGSEKVGIPGHSRWCMKFVTLKR